MVLFDKFVDKQPQVRRISKKTDNTKMENTIEIV